MKILSITFLFLSLLLETCYYLLYKAYCKPKPNGTYGELYGPLVYFKPYIHVVVSVLIVFSILLFVKSIINIRNPLGVNPSNATKSLKSTKP